MARLFAFVVLGFVTTAWSRPQVGGPGGNSDCAHWCADNFPVDTGKVCTSPAAHGTGPCFECGPRSTSPSQKLCSGKCTDTNTDNNNCGSCGTVCPAGISTCKSGVCQTIYQSCPTGSHACISGIISCPTPGGGCSCTVTPEGFNVCANIFVNCDAIKCTKSSECQPGFVCDIGNCCGGVCVDAVHCVNPGSPKKLFKKDDREPGKAYNVPPEVKPPVM